MTDPSTSEELGVRALPPDATPAQRAHAEACWRPSNADQPCRCSDTGCEHGTPCDEADCDGRYLHLDRYPGSMVALSAWWDEYECDTCLDGYGRYVTLPDLPWGEHGTVDGRRTTTGLPGGAPPQLPRRPRQRGG